VSAALHVDARLIVRDRERQRPVTKPTSDPPGREVKGALIKTAAALPHLIIASLLWLVFIAVLPPTLGVGVILLGASVLVLLALGVAEGLAVRILRAARRPTPEEARRLVVPLRLVVDWVDLSGIQLRVVAQGRPVDAAGRRQILLAQEVVDAYLAGRMTDRDMAALIVHGIGRLRWGRTRFDLAGRLWTVPWDLIRGLVVGTGRLLAWVPLGGFAWQTRIIVGAIAVVLETQAGRWPSAIIVAAFIGLTYLIPPWGRAWDRHLDEQARLFASEHGLWKTMTGDAEPTNSSPRQGKLGRHDLGLAAAQPHHSAKSARPLKRGRAGCCVGPRGRGGDRSAPNVGPY